MSGYISQGYWAGHLAIDIAASAGTPIYAADAGYVVAAGWSTVGYGNMVIIDHGNGYRTLYAPHDLLLGSSWTICRQGPADRHMR